ncbi:MAG: DUF554 domain-containing protein [Clostridiales bacterium]|nr:DUF554 domain-containing protein [Clostridiales bacterium]
MIMLGTLVNSAAILVGGALGLLLKKGIPVRISDAIHKGIAMVVIVLGIGGALQGENILIAILSIALGVAIGTLLDLDRRVNTLAEQMAKLVKNENVQEGFVAATLLFCTGAMAVTGAISDGMTGDSTILFTKSLLDGITAMLFAATLGAGTLLSALSVLVYQGAITLLAYFAGPVLTPVMITEIGAVGSVLVMGLGFTMLGAVKLKIMNYVPAVFLPILFCPLWQLLLR